MSELQDYSSRLSDPNSRKFETLSYLPPLTDEQQLSIFRIMQECMTNIAKHAQANQATITVAEAEGIVRLIIRDDGLGFEPDHRADPVEQHFDLVVVVDVVPGEPQQQVLRRAVEDDVEVVAGGVGAVGQQHHRPAPRPHETQP